MRIDWDAEIRADDGLVLRADVFRPVRDGRYPVILTYGPYAKGLAFQDGYPSAWQRMVDKHPDVLAGIKRIPTQSWQVVDPEKRCRTTMPACASIYGPRRVARLRRSFLAARDQGFSRLHRMAGTQAWSNGKVPAQRHHVLTASTSANVAPLQPPHLAAMCIWWAAADWYRDMTHHGGILLTFWANWYDMQVKTVQYGAGERGKHSPVHGELVCGPHTLSEAELARNRADFGDDICKHPLDDAYHKGTRAPVAEGHGAAVLRCQLGAARPAPARQLRGVQGRAVAAKQKWPGRAHGIEHWTHDGTDYGRAQQLAFFDHFLHGKPNGWDKRPKVLLQVRHPAEKFVERAENEWPLKRTSGPCSTCIRPPVRPWTNAPPTSGR